MGFGEAAINLQIIYQNILDLPWQYNKIKGKFQVNSKFNSKTYFFKTPIWYLSNTGGLFVFLICLCHIRTLILDSYAGKNVNILEIIAFFFALGITTQFLVTSFIVQQKSFEITYSIQGTLDLAGVKYVGWPTSERLPDLQELVAYSIAFGSCFLPISISLFSILFDYDPISIALREILPFYPRKIVGPILNLVLGFYAANICISFILLLVAACHMGEKIAFENLCITKCITLKSKLNLVEQLIIKFLKRGLQTLEQLYPKWKNQMHKSKPQRRWADKYLLKVLDKRFQFIVQNYRKQQILMTINNDNMKVFVPAMTLVGLYLCVVSNVGLIKLQTYGVKDIFFVMLTGVLSSICVHFLIVFFAQHAASPAGYNLKTVEEWKKLLHRKEDKLRLLAMPAFGHNMGNFARVTKMTSLDLLMIILDYTITVLMG